MAIMDWLRNRSAKNFSAADLTPEGEMLSGLNIKQVLEAHTAWKDRLKKVLDGASTEELDVSIIAQDDNCTLGQWLYGPGREKYAKLPEYEELRHLHADFHLCAGEVLTEHQDGNLSAATELLNKKFRTASNKNQLAVVKLFAAARNHG